MDILPFANREQAIPSLLNRLLGKAPEESDRYFLILADSGFGKTTLLLNLAFAYSKRAAQTSITMLAIPLGDPNANKVIDEYPMADRIRTILLLDAFDEDPQATPNYQQRLKELLRSTLGFRQIVITCRTQFFPSADERPTLTGTRTYGVNATLEQFTRFFIAPFDDHDVQLYLKKRFPFPQWSLQKKAEGVVYRARNLVARPMLLAHVDVLVRQNRDYKYSIEIYDAMVTHWLASESVKVGKQRYGEYLRAFSKRIAVNIWEHRIERRGLYASVDDIDEVAKSSKVDLDVLTKHNISSRSLLNGTGDGKLKFSHQTILEYFLAAVAFEDTNFLARLDEAQYANAGRVKVFLRERVNLPFPDGRGLTMPFADLLIQLYAGKDPYPGVPFLIGRDSEFRMICWTTTPPSMVRMVSLASNRITVHICYRPEFPVPSSLAAQWAEEAFRDERIAHVQLCGTHRASSQPMMDWFVEAFQRRGIPRRLEVEHVEDFVR